MKKAGKNEIREHNKTLVLNTLRNEDASRIQLSQKTLLSNSAITSIVAELMKQKFVYEKVIAESNGGRKPVILSLNPDAAYVLVLRIDRMHITVALVNFNLQIEWINEYPMYCFGAERVEQALEIAVSQSLANNNVNKDKIVCAGVQIPGVVDHFNNRVVYSTVLDLKNFDYIERAIQKVIHTEVCLFKSSDAELLGESYIRHFDTVSSYLYVVYEMGIGLSFYEKGEIVQFRNGGMQIGHMKMMADGKRKCNCGKYGCVEAYVGENPAIESIMEKMNVNTREELAERLGVDQVNLDTIIEKANGEERFCAEVMNVQSRYLGIVLASVVNLFSPHVIILGGKAGLLDESFKSLIVDTMHESSLDIYNSIPVYFTRTSFESGCVGMGNRIFNELIFKNEN